MERLGILGPDLDATLARAVGGARGAGGVLVAARALDTGAEYGLEVADVILAVNGTPVKSLAQLRSLAGRLRANAPCALQVRREGQLLFPSFEIE